MPVDGNTGEQKDRIDECITHAQGKHYIEELVVDRITVCAREDKEALTFIAENDTTYPFIRWLNQAKDFLFGLVAHEKKWVDSNDPAQGKKIDNHFSMYRGNPDGSRSGFFDAEFNETLPMLKLENTVLVLSGTNHLYKKDANGSYKEIIIDEHGNVEVRPDDTSIRRADSILETTE